MRQGYWYLATPYSNYEGGLEKAFEDACRATAMLLKQGYHVYSPIAHSHSVAKIGGIDPKDHSIWLAADEPMMDAACGLIVCAMPGWEDSFGVNKEIHKFHDDMKDILLMSWPDGSVSKL